MNKFFSSLTTAVLGFALLAGQPVAAQKNSCATVDLKGTLASINSMAWHPDGKSVIVTDPIQAIVHVISPSDGSFRRGDFNKAGSLRKPYLGFRSGDKYVQFGTGGQLEWFDRNMQQMSMSKVTADVDVTHSPDTFKVSFIYDAAAQGGRALIYASGKRPDYPDYTTGFYEYEIRPGGAVPQAWLVQWHEPDDFHALGHPYITVTDDGFFYFLAIGDDSTRLWRYSWGDGVAKEVVVVGLPEIFDARPPWPFNVRTQRRPDTYTMVESFKIPVGLFSQGPFLYILYREPAEDRQGTTWTMFRLQDEGGVAKVLGSMELPASQAAHVSVLPGTVDWVIALKSSVHPDDTPRNNGTQEISHLLTIPAELMAASEGCP